MHRCQHKIKLWQMDTDDSAGWVDWSDCSIYQTVGGSRDVKSMWIHEFNCKKVYYFPAAWRRPKKQFGKNNLVKKNQIWGNHTHASADQDFLCVRPYESVGRKDATCGDIILLLYNLQIIPDYIRSAGGPEGLLCRDRLSQKFETQNVSVISLSERILKKIHILHEDFV